MNRILLIVGAEDRCNEIMKIAAGMGCFEKIVLLNEDEKPSLNENKANPPNQSKKAPHGPLPINGQEYCFEDGM